MKFKIVISFAVFTLFPASAIAQTPPSLEKPIAENKAEIELKRKALLLLAETSQQVRELKNRENQIQARLTLADLMWKDQETAARRLYREAMDILRQSADVTDPTAEESIDPGNSLFQLRTQIVESLGHHDPVMARELLRQTQTKNRNNDVDVTADAVTDVDYGQARRDEEARRLEMNLTAEMADQNPEEAMRAVRNALSQGFSYEIPTLIMKLAQKHPKMASELANELVGKLRKANFKTDHDAIEIVSFLIREQVASRQPTKADGNTKAEGNEQRIQLLDPRTSREFIEFVVDAALKKDSGEYLLMSLTGLREEIEEFAPAQVARITEKLSELEKEYPELARVRRFDDASRTVDVQKMLEAAQTAGPEARDSLFGQAASAAWDQGDKTRAIEIVTRKISNAFERTRQLASFHQREIEESISKENFVQARQLIAQTLATDNKVRQLINLAEALAVKKDIKAAVEMLDEAQSLVPAKPRNANDLALEIELAQGFALADPDRSFSLLGETIDQVNDLIEITARVANFVTWSARLKDNEFDIQSHGTLPGLGSLLSPNIRSLAEVDFAKTRSLFAKFQRPEIRVAANLYLSRIILEPPRDCSCSCPNPLEK